MLGKLRRMGPAVALIAALSAGLQAQQRKVTATNRLFLYDKPAVVRIYSGSLGQWQWGGRSWETLSVSSGSGSIIHPDGYILTNAHVVQATHDGDLAGKKALLFQLALEVLKAKGLAINEASVSQAFQVLAAQAMLSQFKRVNLVVLQSGRQYPFEIKSYGAPSGQGQDLATGKDVSVLKIEVKNAPTLKLGLSDDVQVGDRIYVIGYPGAGDSQLLDAKSSLEPTINDGAISAKKNSADGAPILQTNTSTTHGNSGGPAINDRGELIGLLTFRGNTVNGQEVQGFNFLVPVSTAMEFVRQAGTENRPSPVDAKWREGLEAFWNSEYKYAKADFQEVLALFNEHSEAQKLITECQEHIAKGDDRSGFNLALMGCGGLFVVLAGAVVLVVFLRKRGPRPGQAPLRTPPPVPQPPARPSPNPTEVVKAWGQGGQLVCTAGPLQGQAFDLGPGVFLGRDPGVAQIVVLDNQVSSKHLWVGIIDGRFVARDPGSTNGTFLNKELNQRVSEVVLKNGDVLNLGPNGKVAFQFRNA